MRNSLKYKILGGFLILVLMLAAAGAVSIYEFNRLARSVDALIDDNYKTIEACKRMLGALEREDSGVLTLLLGNGDEGRRIIASADSAFLDALHLASNNLTELGEDSIVAEIQSGYNIYKENWLRTILPNPLGEKVSWYSDTLHLAFLAVRHDVDALMTLNQTSMYQEASALKEKSKRAIMPGIVAIISALVFSLLLNFFISKFFVAPLNTLARAVKNFQPSSDKHFSANIDTYAEIRHLEKAIGQLIDRVQSDKQDKQQQ
jgi:HAMP domain-containing protein